MKNKGFTLNEVLAVIALLAFVGMIATPVIVNVITDTREENRQNKMKTYVKEIYNAYTLTITENNFYSFNSEEKGGITENNIINFTNDWLQKNVDVLGVNCSGENNFSTVFLDIYQEKITIDECIVDNNAKYAYINEEVIKK